MKRQLESNRAPAATPKAKSNGAEKLGARPVSKPKRRSKSLGAKVAAADAQPASSQAEATVAGVKITHPDRTIDEASGLTKLQLARYHDAVSEHLLPYLAYRPLSLVRCPQGADSECFFQKKKLGGMPETIRSEHVAEQEVLYVVDASGIIGLVQFGTVELHGWGCRLPNPTKPDWIVMDLDPDESLPFARVVDAALEMREVLKSVGLESFVKTTGGKGLHVVAPIAPIYDWGTVKAVTRSIAEDFARRKPTEFTANMSKKTRSGKVFIDYLRNGFGATAVLPYSPRARAGATVAMPVTWSDLKRVDPHEFSVATVAALVARRKRDPWADFLTTDQQFPPALEAAMRDQTGA